MNLRKLVRNFFGFSKAETNGLLVLIPLLLLILFSEPIYRTWWGGDTSFQPSDQQLLDSLVLHWKQEQNLSSDLEKNQQRTLFAFNPNNTSKDQLMQLGFSASLASRITNYIEKGGKFRVKKDLLKIYGMDSLLYQDLLPFMLLPEQITKEKKELIYTKTEKPTKNAVILFDVNTADTAQLKTIYGIGEKLSLRIVKYRESLGGFIGKEQLQEIFGLDSAVVSRLMKKSFIAENFQPDQLNLNQATEEELDRHPYLTKKEAKAIITYRFQHGAFSSVEDLKKIQLLPASTITKIKPYVRLN